MTAVKICGITREEDALEAVRLGAHALGFVFHAQSPRNVDSGRTARIVDALPPFVTTVGLFVNPQRDEVERVIGQVPINLLQFHGEEPPDFCASFKLPYIKAVRVRSDIDLIQYARLYRGTRALLLDAFVVHAHGGTGTTFDWNLVPARLPVPTVLSGGLNPANVTDAIRRVRPWAVDVSSGVEASPGVKDARKMAAFFQSVRNADL